MVEGFFFLVMQNAPLEFERLVKVSEQAVAGTMYYLTIEAKDREVKKLYKARVWVKPAMQPTVLRDLKPCYLVTRDAYSNGSRYEFCSSLIISFWLCK